MYANTYRAADGATPSYNAAPAAAAPLGASSSPPAMNLGHGASSAAVSNPSASASSAAAAAAGAAGSFSLASPSSLSTQQQNSLVVSLIHEAESSCAGAKRWLGLGCERVRRLERAWAKLAVAQAELSKQASGCAHTLANMQAQARDFDQHGEQQQRDFKA